MFFHVPWEEKLKTKHSFFKSKVMKSSVEQQILKIIIDKKLKFKNQVKNLIKKASLNIGNSARL